MVPGIGGSEIVVIAVVALIVVGPKDLPKMLRQLGRFVGKMRAMADEFKTSFDDMARQTELDELRKEVDALRSGQSSIVNDISTQMRAIENDITHTPLPAPSFVDTPPPQAEGLPDFDTQEAAVRPKRARKAKVATVEATPDVVVKPKRAPRKKAAT